MSTANASPMIEWGVATLILPGQAISGDLHLVKPFANGALVAVVDGLGHGDEAATAARLAMATLDSQPAGSLPLLLERCHRAMSKTRGAVMSMAWFNSWDNTMTWLGVGNVDGTLLRADGAVKPGRESLMLRGGVVGYQLPHMRESVLPVSPGDTLILVTDGIRANFSEGVRLWEAPQQIADHLMSAYQKGTDDALALVVRYLGGGP